MRTLTVLLMLSAGTVADAQVRIQFGRPPVVQPLRPRVQPQFVFGAKRHLDEQASNMEYQLKLVCLDMHRNYQGNPHFNETYAEAYEMWQLAKHIHELVHDDYHRRRRVDEDHIAEDLIELDGLFHHVEDDIARWRPIRGHHNHPHGRALPQLMEQAEGTLHHLMDDYGTRSQYRKYGDAGDPPAPLPTEPPPPRR